MLGKVWQSIAAQYANYTPTHIHLYLHVYSEVYFLMLAACGGIKLERV